MPRQPTGHVAVWRRKRGVVYAIRFRAYGRRHYVTLGSSEDGWTRARAEDALADVLADVRRGIWRAPEPEPAQEEPRPEPTFHQFASEWFQARRDELAPNTVADYQWQLSNHLLPHFARYRLSAIGIEDVDRYRQAKVSEGRLSAESINKTLTRLGQILEVALEYGLIDRNPAKGKRRRLRVSRPARSWLDRADQIEALLDAAGDLDRADRRDRRGPRRPLIATFVFAGLRTDEALSLRWRDVDLADGRIRIRRSKTDAGVRTVDLLPVLRDELATYKARCGDAPTTEPVFSTRNATAHNPSNVRNRWIAPAVARATARLSDEGLAELPEDLTPRTLRRTFASLLFARREEAPYVMAQMGHTDPKVTLGIYAQVMFRGEGERERLRQLVEGAVCGSLVAAEEPARGYR